MWIIKELKSKKLREVGHWSRDSFWCALDVQVEDVCVFVVGGGYVLSPHFSSSEGCCCFMETVAMFPWN